MSPVFWALLLGDGETQKQAERIHKCFLSSNYLWLQLLKRHFKELVVAHKKWKNWHLKVRTSVLATATSAHAFLTSSDMNTVDSSWVHSALKIRSNWWTCAAELGVSFREIWGDFCLLAPTMNAEKLPGCIMAWGKCKRVNRSFSCPQCMTKKVKYRSILLYWLFFGIS